jgi:CRP-like cAMP-binding protein
MLRIDQAQAEKMREIMIEEHRTRGDLIDNRNMLQSNAYYIKKGAARVFYIKDGKEHTVSFAFDDEYIITDTVIKYVDISLSIVFMEDTDIIYMSKAKMHGIINDLTEVPSTESILFANASLSQYNKYLEERIYVFQSMNATERYQWAMERYPRLVECATLTQIASFLGITKETIYRIRSGKYSKTH